MAFIQRAGVALLLAVAATGATHGAARPARNVVVGPFVEMFLDVEDRGPGGFLFVVATNEPVAPGYVRVTGLECLPGTFEPECALVDRVHRGSITIGTDTSPIARVLIEDMGLGSIRLSATATPIDRSLTSSCPGSIGDISFSITNTNLGQTRIARWSGTVGRIRVRGSDACNYSVANGAALIEHN